MPLGFSISKINLILFSILFHSHEDSDDKCPTATAYVVNSGVVRMVGDIGEGKAGGKTGIGSENCGYTDEGEEMGNGGLSRGPSVCGSDVSELRSQYGSFRGGAKFINGVQVDVTSCI